VRIAVTGSTSGIGEALLRQLREEGHSVIGLGSRGGDVQANLGSAAERLRAAQEIGSWLDGAPLDAFVACAGIADPAPPEQIMSVNYFGVVELARALRDSLALAGSGRIVVLSSLNSTFPEVSSELVELALEGSEDGARRWLLTHPYVPGQAYASSKNAVSRWVRSTVSNECWIGQGIAVIGVAPGVVRTPMTRALLAEPQGRDVLRTLVPMPIGEYQQSEDVAALLAFLLTPSARFLAGQTLFADGGSEALRRPTRPL